MKRIYNYTKHFTRNKIFLKKLFIDVTRNNTQVNPSKHKYNYCTV